MKRLLFFLVASVLSLAIYAQTLEEADSLHQRGRELAEGGNIAEARDCDLRAMEIRKAISGEVSEDYITTFNNYAMTFVMEEDYGKAAELQDRVMDLCSRLSETHPKLSLFSRNAGYANYMLGNYEKAIKYWEMALPLVEKFSKEYEGVLSGLGILYEETGDTRGQHRIMALMEEHNQHELTLPCDEPGCMIERAQYYAVTGNQAMAKECYAKALEMPMDLGMRITVYEAYAQYMANQRDWATGAEYQYMAAILRKESDGGDEAYANSMYKAGMYYYLSRADEGLHKAIDCLDNARNIYTQTGNASLIAKCRQLEGNCFAALRNYAQAAECYRKALAYYEANDKSSDEYPKMIERLASAEKFNKEYDLAIGHYRQALQRYEERGMTKEYADAQNGLSTCYAYAGVTPPEEEGSKYEQEAKNARIEQLDQIISETKESLEITREYLGILSYAQSLGTIAGCNVLKEDYDEAVEYYGNYMGAIREAIRDEFRLQSEAERMNTWKDENINIRDMQGLVKMLPVSPQHLAPQVAALAYDAQLLSKGILLNSSIEFEKVLNELNDKQLTDTYQKIQTNRQEIDRLRKVAETEEDLEKILALTQENQRLQIELNNGCREMNDFTSYISYDWHDVQAALTDRDVCIEFVSIDSGYGESNPDMVALVLTKDAPGPVAVGIWDNERLMDCGENEVLNDSISKALLHATLEKKDLKETINGLKTMVRSSDSPYKSELSLYLNHLENKADTTTGFYFPAPIFSMSYPELLTQEDMLYEGEDAGDIVWEPLSPYLKGKERIFFSADGLFNSIGIEYIRYDGQPLSELFEVYRLSSTKELCYKHADSKPEKAALFGDINYNNDNYNNDATSSETTQRALASLRGAGQDDVFADLSHTLREVNEIQNILKNKGVKDTERFCDTEASKEAFMDLSDSRVNLLHIATHGLFKANPRASDAESMMNSIMAFAGANLDDDALVTAAEIAGMNLRQCDMAVLSACETGLGKQGEDGVFGLQRGFKNAGVHTLLMSLKNVYDDSTAELMISFYKHLMEGSTKREALVKAQRDIRDKGFTDPKYWATFILLDAI